MLLRGSFQIDLKMMTDRRTATNAKWCRNNVTSAPTMGGPSQVGRQRIAKLGEFAKEAARDFVFPVRNTEAVDQLCRS